MKKPNIKTMVSHSGSKPAWNVTGLTLGAKYKIAVVPYIISENPEVLEMQKNEAEEHARFISYCFNNADKID